MRDILVTNNKLSEQCYKDVCNVMYYEDGCIKDVLLIVRSFIHKGHTLLSHPLSGSVKPNENPFKSVLLSGAATETDADSVRIIENAIITAEKFPPKSVNMTEKIRADFATVDFSLIKSAFCNR